MISALRESQDGNHNASDSRRAFVQRTDGGSPAHFASEPKSRAQALLKNPASRCIPGIACWRGPRACSAHGSHEQDLQELIARALEYRQTGLQPVRDAPAPLSARNTDDRLSFVSAPH